MFELVAPLLLPHHGRNLVPIMHLSVCMKVAEAESGGRFVPPVLQICKLKKWQRGTGVCWFDGVHSLTNKQILHLPNKREMSHTLTDKATVIC